MEKNRTERRNFDWGPPPNLPERRRISEAMRITVTPISLEEWLQARDHHNTVLHDSAAYENELPTGSLSRT